jgi:hypothetical protein
MPLNQLLFAASRTTAGGNASFNYTYQFVRRTTSKLACCIASSFLNLHIARFEVSNRHLQRHEGVQEGPSCGGTCVVYCTAHSTPPHCEHSWNLIITKKIASKKQSLISSIIQMIKYACNASGNTVKTNQKLVLISQQ